MCNFAHFREKKNERLENTNKNKNNKKKKAREDCERRRISPESGRGVGKRRRLDGFRVEEKGKGLLERVCACVRM